MEFQKKGLSVLLYPLLCMFCMFPIKGLCKWKKILNFIWYFWSFVACGEHLGIPNDTPMSLYNNAHIYFFVVCVLVCVCACVCVSSWKKVISEMESVHVFVDINFYFLHFVGTNFREWLIFLHFAGINFREWPFFLHFAGTNFRELKAIRESLFPRKFIPRKFIPRKFITLR